MTVPAETLRNWPAPAARPVLGDGRLSPEAQARLARAGGTSAAEPPPPDLADQSTAGRAAVARWRAAEHEAWGEGTVAGEIEHRPISIAGVTCWQAGREDAPTVVYLHGGGYALGSPGVAAPITARLAQRLHVVSVDYRLAPEHPFPAGLCDALAVYEALTARAGPVAVAGDSAGGGLAVALAVAVGAAARPSALVLLCPFLDHRARPLEPLSTAYRGGIAADHPLVSPLGAPLGALPPTLLQTGTGDALFPQALAFARRARAAGVAVTLDVWQGLWHTWHYHRELPEAHAALAEAGDFVAVAAAGHASRA